MSGYRAVDGMARIKVIGVGGGGCNAVSRMYRERISGVEYVAMNTDSQALLQCDLPSHIKLGERLTRGLGVGGDPERGRMAAEESREDLVETVRDTDMIFIAAGMGGGTGTGVAPVLAEIAKESEALTIGVVTRPFRFEGVHRRKAADDGIRRMREKVDTLLVIPNDRLLEMADENLTMEQAFELADDVLRRGVQAIAELATVPGDINLDFADIKTIMTNAGPAWMAMGEARGEGRAVEAARAAINSPLLDVRIDGATGVLFNVTGGSDLTVKEVYEAAEAVRAAVDPDANIIFGMATDLKLIDEVKVTLIATGFPLRESNVDDDFDQLLKNDPQSHSLSDLEVPTFLRRQASPLRRGRLF
jgi:cell division protein FtsZ